MENLVLLGEPPVVGDSCAGAQWVSHDCASLLGGTVHSLRAGQDGAVVIVHSQEGTEYPRVVEFKPPNMRLKCVFFIKVQ